MRPQRLLIGPTAYAASLFRSAAAGWNRFFFTPADPTPLGFLRVCVGLLAFWSILVYGFDLRDYFGDVGWASRDVVREYWAERAPNAWSFWLIVPDAWLRPVWVACLVVCGLFTLGVASRTTSVLTWIVLVSTARRAPFSLFGFDQAVSTWALYLAVSGASGRAVSLDRYFERLREFRAKLKTRPKDGPWRPPSGAPTPSIPANIGLRLVQLHLIVVYGMAGLAKLQGRAWWEGTAIWGTLGAGEFARFNFLRLAEHPVLLNLMTHGALALELLYPVLIWVGALRPLMVVSAIGLHVGIAATVGLSEFSLAMIAANFTFASGAWLRSLVAGREQPAGKVLYDGACPRCRTSMAVLVAGDPDRVIQPVDLTAVDVATVHRGLTKEACLRSMHVVRADGRVEEGYDAVVRLLSWIPLFQIPALVRFVPGFGWAGRRIYRRIAESRPRDAVCDDEVCGLHPAPKPARLPESAARGNRP